MNDGTHTPNLEALDALWKRRHDPASINEFEAAISVALGSQAQNYALLWRAARCSHFRAMQSDASGDSEQAKEYFHLGAKTARDAHAIDTHGIDGIFWCGVNEVEVARHKSSFAALGVLKKSTALIERAANIDETYHFAGPLRVLGRIIHRKPLLLGGSANVAIEYFKRARQIAPRNSTTLLYLAEALLTEQFKHEAREVLNKIISAPDDEDWRWEQARDRKLARTLIAKI